MRRLKHLLILMHTHENMGMQLEFIYDVGNVKI